MAWDLPSNAVIVPGRFLIDPISIDSDCCVGNVVQEGTLGYSSMVSHLSLSYTITNGQPGEPPIPAVLGKFQQIVFKREAAQEVDVDGKTYFLIHENDILAFVPPA